MCRPTQRLAFATLVALLVGCGRDGDLTAVPMTQAANGAANADIVTFDPNTFNLIASGSNFTCAARNNGTTYCWGQNDQQQIGTWPAPCDNKANCVAVPTVVRKHTFGPDSIKAIELDAGDNHACILDSKSDAWCWGSGSAGQNGLGNGQRSMSEAVPVVGNLKFQSIAAGGASTCGTSSNVVFCWGTLGDSLLGGTPAPTRVSPDARFPIVVVGGNSGCVLRTSRGGPAAVDCWGQNMLGQLGIAANNKAIPFARASAFGTSVVAMSMSTDLNCVELSDGTVKCAGNNSAGQAGAFPGLPFTSTPQTIANGMQLHGVTTGGAHACALDAANAAWCWGFGRQGQLGNGTWVSSSTVQRVAGGIAFRRLSAGSSHTCGIGFDNHIYCWGSNSHGQLGIGDESGGGTNTPRQTRDP